MKRRIRTRLKIKAANIAFYSILLRPAQALVRRFSSVGQYPVFDTKEFAWAKALESGWTDVRDELRAVLAEPARIPSVEELSAEQLRIVQNDKWRSYWLHVWGKRIEENCERCPKTAKLVEAIPGMKTAFFSILAPRAHLSAHYGLYAGFLRCHLGLIIPREKEACRIRVQSDVAHWEEGKNLIFDDTYLHEVWNDTDEERVVLFIDFARPLPFPVSVLNEIVMWVFARTHWVQEILEGLRERGRRGGSAAAGIG
jgi:ornithine lipid ester-linked acyl 2-hydroxylase